MIVLCGGAKGGCGKTTLAINLAVYYQSRNIDVAILDADPEPHSANFAKRRESKGELGIPHAHVQGDIFHTITSMNDKHDIVIIDVGGADSVEQRSALGLAHIALFPVKPSQLDIETVPSVINAFRLSKANNRNLQGRFVMMEKDSHVNDQDAPEVMEYLRSIEDIPVMKYVTGDRKAFKRSIGQGKGVIEMADRKAMAEIQLIGQETLKIAEELAANV